MFFRSIQGMKFLVMIPSWNQSINAKSWWITSKESSNGKKSIDEGTDKRFGPLQKALQSTCLLLSASLGITNQSKILIAYIDFVGACNLFRFRN